MKKKIALITGVTGQDGSYLSDLLLNKGYTVHGIKRKTSLINTERLDHIYNHVSKSKKFFLHYGDVSDSENINYLIKKIKPTEIYNLAAQSNVATSFKIPYYTSQIVGLGALKILEAIKNLNLIKHTKFYQAGSSEMYGKVHEIPQNEQTPFHPQSPYAVAKLYAHWMTRVYRDSYGIFASNGILFNHESPNRGETFVTRKITIGLSKIKCGKQKKLTLGNIYAKRDWGHAKDYVNAIWKILQLKKPGDYVISTGEQYSVKEFADVAAKELNMKIKWKGKGINTKGYDEKNRLIINCSKKYFRPLEVDTLLGNSQKAKKYLKWKSSFSFTDLVKDMVVNDLKKIVNDK
jgi:GDPmannose 4,6-dehydratase